MYSNTELCVLVYVWFDGHQNKIDEQQCKFYELYIYIVQRTVHTHTEHHTYKMGEYIIKERKIKGENPKNDCAKSINPSSIRSV